ncbi:uncharacterized protein LOC106660792 isoform X1 [Cimex lectularius]|uniref:C2H2-type domain-containing protein n=1 Tax=Cimex lectularius TaxID=79782 RepID=A0A8I6TAZ1_CIMLE|nr:uncharacterized protein LOC106660792 isoform X1 [Cimex lectularius]
MPRRKSQGAQPNKSFKSAGHLQEKGPLGTSVIDKNDKALEKNGLDRGSKMVRESETNKYLHKKFKKVATLEDTTPGKAKERFFPTVEETISPVSPGWNGRSRSHPLKMDSQSSEEEENQPEVKKIYKPKFHLEEIKPSEVQKIGVSSSTDVLHMRINKLISDNQAIVNDATWPKKTSSSLRNGDSKESLSLRVSACELEEPQPLNLTVKESRKRSLSETLISDGSIIKNILLKTREKPDVSKITNAILHPCPNCKIVFQTIDNLNTHLYSCKSKSSPGPLLGKTPLVDGFNDLKKRKIDFSLKLDEKKSVKLFGGEVQILDSPAGESKILRIDGRKEVIESMMKKEVVTISKTGLHSVGGTMIQSESISPKPIYPEKMVLPILPTVAPPNVPGIASPLKYPSTINPLTSITAYNSLTLQTLTPESLSPLKPTNSCPYNGVMTILHAGKPIPFVQGIPGPNSLLSPQPLIPKKPEKTVIIQPAQQKVEQKPLPPLRIDVEERLLPSRTNLETDVEVGEKKFLRPSTLPLKPGSYTPKRSLTTPNAICLVSPETPRPRKAFCQLFLNGHAYTGIGLKCSTKTFFCTLNSVQPTYLPLMPNDKVSMYSQWLQIRKDPVPLPPSLELDPKKAIAQYDSRNRDSSYTISNRDKKDLITHSTFYTDRELTEMEKVVKNGGENDSHPMKIKVCEGGFESNEDYIYIRGRGRGRYVCEECGIRCKKPSMLKKHIRTHTDLRPYTCKYCTFSFKTKGNLTKHMKSKSHYKRCKELDISPIPTSIEDYPDKSDNENLEEKGLEEEDDESEEETEDDEEEEEEEEEDKDSIEEGDGCKIEREAAKSLLSLSERTLEAAHRQYISAGLISQISRPRSYPYNEITSEKCPEEKAATIESWWKDLLMLNKDCHELRVKVEPLKVEPLNVEPLEEESKPLLGCAKTSVITSVGGPVVVPPISSNIENIPPSVTTPTEYPENSLLLHAYLTERALKDSMVKHQQVYESKSVVDEELKEENNVEEEESVVQAIARMDVKKIIRIPTPPVDTSTQSPPTKLAESPNKHRKAEFFPPSNAPNLSYISTTEDGRSMCVMCNKVFNKPSQLRLHVNIHYFERPFRCDSCAVSFRTKGHLQKHQRSLAHLNKVNMNSTFGTATTSNPRPFKCDYCKVAFRIHGHLAKHFRSKLHIMKLECVGKLPFGTYADLEKFGVNMNDIDTTDCENSLESLQLLAAKMAGKDPKDPSRPWEDSSDCSTKGSEDEPLTKKVSKFVGGLGSQVRVSSPPIDPSEGSFSLTPCFQKKVNF